MHRLSLVAASRGYSSLLERASHCSGFSCCGAQALWYPQYLWCPGLVSPMHVESSRPRDQTCVPCTGRQILHWTTLKQQQSEWSREQSKRRQTPAFYSFDIWPLLLSPTPLSSPLGPWDNGPPRLIIPRLITAVLFPISGKEQCTRFSRGGNL